MRFADHSRLDIRGVSLLRDREDVSRDKLYLRNGLVLIFLLGVGAPLVALLTGITGPASAVLVAGAVGIYIGYLVFNRSLLAGWTAAIPVLATFNMGVPLTKAVGRVRVELMPVDVFLVTLGVYAILDGIDSVHGHVRAVCRLTSVFAVLALFIGVVTWVGGYPLTGVWFGVNQIRYPLIVFAGVATAYRYGFRPLIALLYSVFTVHLSYAVIESLLGHSLGLSYFGDAKDVAGIHLGASDVFGVTLHSGLYPGGFVGTSRALLAVLWLIFPLAVYWVRYSESRYLPAYGIVLGVPILTVISKSDTGLGILVVATVAIITAASLPDEIRSVVPTAYALALSVVGVLGGVVLVWIVLTQGIFENSAIRVAHYRAALSLFVHHPLTGVGGKNFAYVISLYQPDSVATNVLGIHNNILAYLAELGFFGVILYVSAAAIVFVNGLDLYLSNYTEAIAACAVVIGFVSFHAYSSLTLIYQRPPVMMVYWLLTGGAIVYFTRGRQHYSAD